MSFRTVSISSAAPGCALARAVERGATSLWLAGIALLIWAAVPGAMPRHVADRAEEPRLILPGGHIVRVGQWIDLRWSPADSVAELEILLSVDGGAHYSRCISPQLDPNRSEFLWRVPDLGSETLRMRIRFNRGGREIEGAPTPPLRLFAGGTEEPEPLALPLTGEPGGPQPASGRGATPDSKSAPSSCEAREEDPTSDRPASSIEFSTVTSLGLDRPARGRVPHTALATPRFLPLRA